MAVYLSIFSQFCGYESQKYVWCEVKVVVLCSLLRVKMTYFQYSFERAFQSREWIYVD